MCNDFLNLVSLPSLSTIVARMNPAISFSFAINRNVFLSLSASSNSSLVNGSTSLKVFIVPFTEIQLAIDEKCREELSTVIMRRSMMRIAERIAEEKRKDHRSPAKSVEEGTSSEGVVRR